MSTETELAAIADDNGLTALYVSEALEESKRHVAELRAERDDLRVKVARLARHIDDGLRIVNMLAEEVGNECQPEDGVCHEHDLTEDGECPLVVDLERASAALQGTTRARD